MTLAIKYFSLDDLKGAEQNPKRHALPALKASIERFGFADAIVLDDRTGRLVAGHGRLDSLQELRAAGGEPPEGVGLDGLDWLVPVQTGWASKDDGEASAFLVAANRLTEVGGWDEQALGGLLAEVIGTSELGLEGTGYDQADLEALLGEHDTVTGDAPIGDMPSSYQVVITCGNERQQVGLLEELTGRGLDVRAIVI